MNHVYLVCLHLRSPRENYWEIQNELTRSPEWWHYLEWTWMVATEESLSELADRLKPHMTEQDSYLITELHGPCEGWLPDAAWSWIDQNVPSLAKTSS
jgi:hypothetical protein